MDWIQTEYLELIDSEQLSAAPGPQKLKIGILVYDAGCPETQRINGIPYKMPDEIVNKRIAGYRLNVTLSSL